MVLRDGGSPNQVTGRDGWKPKERETGKWKKCIVQTQNDIKTANFGSSKG